MSIKETDLAWAAGIVDGEGSIGLIRMKRYDNYGTGVTYDLRLDVGNTDPRMLKKLQDLFGGSISRSMEKRENRKPCATWHLHGSNAANVLAAIRPYLVIKGEQADVAIKSRQFVRRNKRVTTEGLAMTASMTECFLQLKALKHAQPALEEVLGCPAQAS